MAALLLAVQCVPQRQKASGDGGVWAPFWGLECSVHPFLQNCNRGTRWEQAAEPVPALPLCTQCFGMATGAHSVPELCCFHHVSDCAWQPL